MSECGCDHPTNLRATSEAGPVSTDPEFVMIRCDDCGGKLAYVPIDIFTDLPRPESESVTIELCVGDHPMMFADDGD